MTFKVHSSPRHFTTLWTIHPSLELHGMDVHTLKQIEKNTLSMGAIKAICIGSTQGSTWHSNQRRLPKSCIHLTQQHMWHKPHERGTAFLAAKTTKTSRRGANGSNSLVISTHCRYTGKRGMSEVQQADSKSSLSFEHWQKYLLLIFEAFCLLMSKLRVRPLCLTPYWVLQAVLNKPNVLRMRLGKPNCPSVFPELSVSDGL